MEATTGQGPAAFLAAPAELLSIAGGELTLAQRAERRDMSGKPPESRRLPVDAVQSFKT